MPSSYPSALDEFIDPQASQPMNNPSHAGHHANINASLSALQQYIGVSGSAVESTITYRVGVLETGKAAVVHSHLISDVSGLQTALDSKAAFSHAHIIADVTGLQTALDGKSATGHTHDDRYYTEGEIDGFGFLTSETDPVFLASPAAGITGTKITHWDTAYGWGNHALAGYLTDLSGLSTSELAEGSNLYYSEARVSANADVSANSAARHSHANKALLDTYDQTNANLSSAVAHKDLTNNPHSVTKAQVGLANAENTSDLNKPISTATQTALDAKLEAADIADFETTTELNARDTANRDRANHTGAQAQSTVTDLVTDLAAKIPLTQKAANNGVATLDAGGKVPASQLPSTVMEFKGAWAASTNTPTLADGTGDAGDIYLASDAGTVDFGSGDISFSAGDWAVYNGSVWQRSINSNAVVSVNGQQGAVVLDTGDIAEDGNLYFTDARVEANADVAANTAARHSHANKATLDAISAAGSGSIITSAERTKLAGIETGAQVNTVASVFGRTGAVTAAEADYNSFYSLLGHTHAFSEITSTLDPTTQLGTGSGAVTLAAGGTNQNVTIVSSGTGKVILKPGTNSADAIQFQNSVGTAQLTLNTSSGALIPGGRLLLGTDTPRTIGSVSSLFQIDSGSAASLSSTRNTADAGGPIFNFGKSRGTGAGGVTAVTLGDQLMRIDASGADGSTLTSIGARLMTRVDGTVSTGIVPGRWEFWTANTSGVLAEHMRITSSGDVGIGTTTISAKSHITSTTEQLRLGYDASNYCSFTVGSTGNIDITPSGGGLIQFARNSTGTDSKIKLINEQNAAQAGSSLEFWHTNASSVSHRSTRIVGERWSASANFGFMAFEIGGNNTWFRRATLDVNGTFTAITLLAVSTLSADGTNPTGLHYSIAGTTPGAGVLRHGFWAKDNLNLNIRASNSDFMALGWNGNLAIGPNGTFITATPTTLGRIESRATDRAQLALSHDASNYLAVTVSSGGAVTLAPTGTSVGINGAPNANAALDVQSTTKAFMPPRMTTTQRDAIPSPTEGMYIHNITTKVLEFYNGTSWGAV